MDVEQFIFDMGESYIVDTNSVVDFVNIGADWIGERAI
jgi:hypothetical protein